MEHNDNKKELKDKDYEIMWNFIFHQDNLFTSRINFLLVAVALSITSLFHAVSADQPNVYLASIAAFIGLFICFVWLYVSFFSLQYTSSDLKGHLTKKFDWYNDIVKRRSKVIGPHNLMGYYLPVILAVVIILIYVQIWGRCI